jgi:hypothetical protein
LAQVSVLWVRSGQGGRGENEGGDDSGELHCERILKDGVLLVDAVVRCVGCCVHPFRRARRRVPRRLIYLSEYDPTQLVLTLMQIRYCESQDQGAEERGRDDMFS